MNSQQTLRRVTPPSPEEELREARRAERMFRRRQHRRARVSLWATIGTTVLLLSFIGFFYLQIQSTLARAQYPALSDETCDSMEHGTYHIHVHFSIYINGKLLNIPAGIGIAADGSCFYWMHTHNEDGIIHIEAPGKVHNVALDDFITIWQEGFSKLNFPPQMLDQTGWNIWVNGKPFDGVVTSPLHTEVTFHSHDAITMEYGSPNPPPDLFYSFPANLPQ